MTASTSAPHPAETTFAPLQTRRVLSMPAGVLSTAKALDGWVDGRLGEREPRTPATEMHAEDVLRRGDPHGQGKLEGRLASERAKQDREPERRRAREQRA